MNDISPVDIMAVVQEQQREITGLKMAIASLRRRLEEAQVAREAPPASNNSVAEKVAV